MESAHSDGRSELADKAEQTELSADLLAQQMRKLVDSVAKGLPKEAVDVLHSIESTLGELLPRLREMQERGIISIKDSFTVIETVRRYLPDTLAAYLRLPKLYAQVQTLADGRTASRTLLDQLHVLDTSLKEVAKNASRAMRKNSSPTANFSKPSSPKKPRSLPDILCSCPESEIRILMPDTPGGRNSAHSTGSPGQNRLSS